VSEMPADLVSRATSGEFNSLVSCDTTMPRTTTPATTAVPPAYPTGGSTYDPNYPNYPNVPNGPNLPNLPGHSHHHL